MVCIIAMSIGNFNCNEWETLVEIDCLSQEYIDLKMLMQQVNLFA